MTRRITSDTGPSVIIPIWVLDAVGPRALAVYTRIAAAEFTGTPPARSAIAAALEASVDTIDRAIDELVAVGAIEVDRAGRTRTYRILRVRPTNRNGAAPGDSTNRNGAASTGPPSRKSAASTEGRALYLDLETGFRDMSTPSTPDPHPFEAFWETWPRRNGKRIGRSEAEQGWARLTAAERTAAMIGATHYATASAAGMAGAMDAHRWLTRKAWVDWQTPAVADQREGPPRSTAAVAIAMLNRSREVGR